MDEMRSLKMPRMMYGTAWKKERTTELVIQAVKAGFRGIDTACQPKVDLPSDRDWHSGIPSNREDLVGEALVSLIKENVIRREDIFIQTKYTPISGQDPSQPLPYDPQTQIQTQVQTSLQTSLRNLQTPYIDSVILHSPLPKRSDTLTALKTLESMKQEGKIRMTGLSNCYDPRLIQWLLDQGVRVEVIQNRWYEGNGFDWDVYDLCLANGIRYQSFWTLTGSPNLLRHSLLLRVAKTNDLTPEQALYKLCLLWGITPLIGSTTLRHVQEALAVQSSDGLTKESEGVDELWTVMRGIS